MRKHYISLFLGIVAGVAGQLLLKAGAAAPDIARQLLNGRTIAGLAFYGAATVFYMIAIRRIPLSVAFPSISVSYVFVLVLGASVFGESLTIAKVAGVVMIGGGVWILNRRA